MQYSGVGRAEGRHLGKRGLMAGRKAALSIGKAFSLPVLLQGQSVQQAMEDTEDKGLPAMASPARASRKRVRTDQGFVES